MYLYTTQIDLTLNFHLIQIQRITDCQAGAIKRTQMQSKVEIQQAFILKFQFFKTDWQTNNICLGTTPI